MPFLSRRNYHFEFRHILIWGVMAGMVEGNLAAVVVAKTFGGGDWLVNIAASTPVAAHMASLFWGTLCVGRPKIRLLTVCTAGVVLFGASVGLTEPGSRGAWLFLLQMAAAQFCMTGAVTLRSALWKSNYPQQIRAQVAARLQIVRAGTRLSAVAVASFMFDLDPLSYRWVYPAAAVAGVIAIAYMRRIRVRGERRELERVVRGPGEAAGDERFAGKATVRQALSPAHVMRGAWRVVVQDARYRKYLMAQMLAGMANLTIRSVAVAIITKRVLVNMRGEYWMSGALLELLPMVTLLLTMPRFARYFDRVGVLRFRVVHGMCWSANIVFGLLGTLCVVYADALGPNWVIWSVACFALFAVTRGVCYAGGSIAWNLGHLHYADSSDAEVYMGIHVSLTGLRGLLLPSLGMVLWTQIGWWVWCVSLFFSVAAIVSFRSLQRSEADESASQR